MQLSDAVLLHPNNMLPVRLTAQQSTAYCLFRKTHCHCWGTCPVCCRLCRRKQQMSLQARRQLGYTGGTGKKDDKRHVLLTEDVAEALKDVRDRL